MSEIITVGLDLAKNVFQAHGADASGRPRTARSMNHSQAATPLTNAGGSRRMFTIRSCLTPIHPASADGPRGKPTLSTRRGALQIGVNLPCRSTIKGAATEDRLRLEVTRSASRCLGQELAEQIGDSPARPPAGLFHRPAMSPSASSLRRICWTQWSTSTPSVPTRSSGVSGSS